MFPTFTLRYSKLPAHFFEPFTPVVVEKPALIAFNQTLAETLGFDLSAFDERQAADWFSGNELPPGQNPWPRPMPATSLAAFRRDWVMAVRCCWGK